MLGLVFNRSMEVEVKPFTSYQLNHDQSKLERAAPAKSPRRALWSIGGGFSIGFKSSYDDVAAQVAKDDSTTTSQVDAPEELSQSSASCTPFLNGDELVWNAIRKKQI